MIGTAAALALVAGPVITALIGVSRAWRDPERPAGRPAWEWQSTVSSALLYVLAFNLTFFVQELFLVVPKALTPGLRPTLYHNNHGWDGVHPLAELFQGTGVLAILISASLCAWLLRRDGRTSTVVLLLVWMVFSGCFMALPQVVIGAIVPLSDFGRAMRYLELADGTRTVMALAALAAMPWAALWLSRRLLCTAATEDEIATRSARARFVFLRATLPALAALPVIALFRVPRELGEVVGLPVIVTMTGVVWMQAWSWHVSSTRVRVRFTNASATLLVGAVLAMLLVFQLVLRPGIAFY